MGRAAMTDGAFVCAHARAVDLATLSTCTSLATLGMLAFSSLEVLTQEAARDCSLAYIRLASNEIGVVASNNETTRRNFSESVASL